MLALAAWSPTRGKSSLTLGLVSKFGESDAMMRSELSTRMKGKREVSLENIAVWFVGKKNEFVLAVGGLRKGYFLSIKTERYRDTYSLYNDL